MYMGLNCPLCGNIMVKQNVDTIVGYTDAWYCRKCDSHYSEKRIKKILSST